MSVGSILRAALGGALVINAVPHGVSGVQGKPFPTPFSDPPGVADSPPLVNVGWSAANAIAGAVLLPKRDRSTAELIAVFVGAITAAAVVSYHFGEVRQGRAGLRGRGIRN
ncbi:hypothetical protein [Microbacterium sp. C7(2022)]|uniref:hypothetical protein n=1 Tax=Microbacterium sp. C7(2022) TaxID=2992759 RepID=UPI00237AB2B7|nr:hypothetical protein [Microbacterium sp. C7(2022)]MDE0546118.1 hypothetical protein [Microbacterium sp. C7(2022)]